MAMTTNADKPKKSAKKNAPAETIPPESVESKDEIKFGTTIETDRIKVEIDGTKIRYYIKATRERLEKDYGNVHAVMIIHGRISRDPHGPYTQACLGKIRAANLKSTPI
jgi:hypothetical protein